MRHWVVVVVAVVLSLSVGCSGIRLSHVNSATLAISTATLICDGMQTISASGDGWVEYSETNPIMGRNPGTGAVAAYFATAVIANAALWVVMPDRYKSAIPAAVSTRQAMAIGHNAGQDVGVCGL